jgi:metal-responsive CopG/Arc/MetJ family transcriptional regulator
MKVDLRKKRNFSINLPAAVVDELDELKKTEHRSRSNLVEYFIRIGMEVHKKRLKIS